MSFTEVKASIVIEACENYIKYIEKKREQVKEETIIETMNLPRTWYRWFPPRTREKALKYILDDCWFGSPWSDYYVPSSVENLLKLAKSSSGFVFVSEDDIWILHYNYNQ